MNERLKLIRKHFNLSQKEFGEKICLAQDHISSLEKGRRNITDRTIRDICSTFNVNETWFRNGTGDMFIDLVSDLDVDEETKEILRKFQLLSDEDKEQMKKILDTFLK